MDTDNEELEIDYDEINEIDDFEDEQEVQIDEDVFIGGQQPDEQSDQFDQLVAALEEMNREEDEKLFEHPQLSVIPMAAEKEKRKKKEDAYLMYSNIKEDKNTITIPNVREPWRILHNDATLAVPNQDGEYFWPSVSHALYASILLLPREKSVIAELPVNKVRDYAEKAATNDIRAIEKAAFEAAYKHLFTSNISVLAKYYPDKVDFIYESGDSYFGTGKDGTGKNVLGNIITALYAMFTSPTGARKTVKVLQGSGLHPYDDGPFSVQFDGMIGNFSSVIDFVYFSTFTAFNNMYMEALPKNIEREKYHKLKQQIATFRQGIYVDSQRRPIMNEYVVFRYELFNTPDEEKMDAYDVLFAKVKTRFYACMVKNTVISAYADKFTNKEARLALSYLPKKPVVAESGFLKPFIEKYCTKEMQQLQKSIIRMNPRGSRVIDMTEEYTFFKDWIEGRLFDVFYNLSLFFPGYINIDLVDYNFKIFMDEIYSRCDDFEGIVYAPYPEAFYNQVKSVAEKFPYDEGNYWQQLTAMKNYGENNMYRLWNYISNLLYRLRLSKNPTLFLARMQKRAIAVLNDKDEQQRFNIIYGAIRRILYVFHSVSRKIGSRWGIRTDEKITTEYGIRYKVDTSIIVRILLQFLRFDGAVEEKVDKDRTEIINKDLKQLLYTRLSSGEDSIDGKLINQVVASIDKAYVDKYINNTTLSRIFMYMKDESEN